MLERTREKEGGGGLERRVRAEQDDAAAAMRLLNTLPPKERMVLSMQVLDGHSQREIAWMLGFSEGYVSKLLARAWKSIRAAGWEVDDAP